MSCEWYIAVSGGGLFGWMPIALPQLEHQMPAILKLASALVLAKAFGVRTRVTSPQLEDSS